MYILVLYVHVYHGTARISILLVYTSTTCTPSIATATVASCHYCKLNSSVASAYQMDGGETDKKKRSKKPKSPKKGKRAHQQTVDKTDDMPLKKIKEDTVLMSEMISDVESAKGKHAVDMPSECVDHTLPRYKHTATAGRFQWADIEKVRYFGDKSLRY